MSNKVNPTHITIQHDGKDTDGNALGTDGLTFRGFDLAVAGQPFLTLPAVLNDAGTYEGDIADKVRALPNGTDYALTARTIAADVDGVLVYSGFAEAADAFDVNFTRAPTAPFSVALS